MRGAARPAQRSGPSAVTRVPRAAPRRWKGRRASRQIGLSEDTVTIDRRHVLGKRLFDLALVPVLLVLAMPVMAGIALAILLTSGRPVLFRQQRIGRQGVPFTMYKFRTMSSGAETEQDTLRARNERQSPLFKLDTDPRVTPLGQFLRDSSLDELPQLFNVVSGRMGLVGPRPALPAECRAFPPTFQAARVQVRPGLTGPWQLWGRDEPSFTLYQELDLRYLRRCTVATDIVLLAITVPLVVRRAVRRWTGRRIPDGMGAHPPRGLTAGRSQRAAAGSQRR
jgi:lipopolysaccharide/colanic/teichoic acid biosynthesis glycosyltransferase